jgi:Ca2+-binding EF-hand superfamily protein
MNKLLMGGAIAAFAVTIAPAVAQPAPPPPPGVASGTAPAVVGVPKVRMMVMSDKTMTRDDAANHVRDLFARLDTNRDGYLTREEVDSARDKMMGMHGDMAKRMAEGGAHQPDRGAMFDKLDTDRNGSISRQEYMAAKPQVREQRVIVMRDGAAAGVPGTPATPGAPGMKMRMHAMGAGMHFGGRLFDVADANHDGRVSLAEAQAAALAHFDRADINHDGKITPDERRQAHQMIRERRSS